MAEQTPDTFLMTPELGRRLRSLRVSAGLSQNRFAALFLTTLDRYRAAP